MARYKVTKIYQYTETVFVDAESEREAFNMADNMEGDRNFDDTLSDAHAREADDDDE